MVTCHLLNSWSRPLAAPRSSILTFLLPVAQACALISGGFLFMYPPPPPTPAATTTTTTAELACIPEKDSKRAPLPAQRFCRVTAFGRPGRRGGIEKERKEACTAHANTAGDLQPGLRLATEPDLERNGGKMAEGEGSFKADVAFARAAGRRFLAWTRF